MSFKANTVNRDQCSLMGNPISSKIKKYKKRAFMLTKTISKTICLCLTAFLLIQAFFIVPTAVSFAEDGAVTYESGGVTLTGSSSDDHYYEVNIPEEIDGLPVTAIDASAFKDNCNITSVTDPPSVYVPVKSKKSSKSSSKSSKKKKSSSSKSTSDEGYFLDSDKEHF